MSSIQVLRLTRYIYFSFLPCVLHIPQEHILPVDWRYPVHPKETRPVVSVFHCVTKDIKSVINKLSNALSPKRDYVTVRNSTFPFFRYRLFVLCCNLRSCAVGTDTWMVQVSCSAAIQRQLLEVTCLRFDSHRIQWGTHVKVIAYHFVLQNLWDYF